MKKAERVRVKKTGIELYDNFIDKMYEALDGIKAACSLREDYDDDDGVIDIGFCLVCPMNRYCDAIQDVCDQRPADPFFEEMGYDPDYEVHWA